MTYCHIYIYIYILQFFIATKVSKPACRVGVARPHTDTEPMRFKGKTATWRMNPKNKQNGHRRRRRKKRRRRGGGGAWSPDSTGSTTVISIVIAISVCSFVIGRLSVSVHILRCIGARIIKIASSIAVMLNIICCLVLAFGILYPIKLKPWNHPKQPELNV